MQQRASAFILAGGYSSRMGRPKAFVYLGGQTLIERIINTLRPLFQEVYIVARSREPFLGLGLEVVVDIFRERGPAAGIHAGLSHSRTEWNFVTACDMPFLNPDLITYMAERLEGCDILLPRFEGRVEPLHGFYSRRVLSPLERMLHQAKASMKELVARCKTEYIEEEEIKAIDPAALSLWSLNTPEALEAARRLVINQAK